MVATAVERGAEREVSVRLFLAQGAAVLAIYAVGSWLIGGAGVHYPSFVVGALSLAAVRVVREAMDS